MARILRSQLPDGYFHVTANSVHEAPLFLDALDRLLFLSLFRRALVRFDLRYHVYCLMGTHYHTILEGRTEDLSRAAQWYQSHYAREHNARHERRGALFAQRFSSWVIDSEEHYEAAIEYVLDNPVRAGLVRDRSKWPWSGAPRGTPLLVPQSSSWPTPTAPSLTAMSPLVSWR